MNDNSQTLIKGTFIDPVTNARQSCTLHSEDESFIECPYVWSTGSHCFDTARFINFNNAIKFIKIFGWIEQKS